MNIKYKLASIVSKTLCKVCRAAKFGGTSFPGKAASIIYPDALKEAAKNYKIIMVTGTNGKTTTTHIIGQILEENGIKYITNKSGANLTAGIASTFLNSTKLFGESPVRTALIEVDEAAFNKICDFVEPDILIVTNFFRDQLDRYGELYSTLNNVRLGVQKLKNTKLILNADDSMCASLGRGSDKRLVYFGIGPNAYKNAEKPAYSDAMYCIYCKNKYIYSNYIYGHLGGFRCTNCGYMRPPSSITCSNIDELNSSDSLVQISIESSEGNKTKKELYKTRIGLPGLYNIYNSLAALSCGVVLGLPVKNSLKCLGSLKSGFGRMEEIDAGNKKIWIILVKNPSGFNQAIDLLTKAKKQSQIALIINDKVADGTDISWLWDVNFGKLQRASEETGNIFVSGIRAEDMALRLKYDDFNTAKISIIKDYDKMICEGLDNSLEDSSFYILASYTAMLDIRKHLKDKFGLKEFWE